MRNGDFLGDRFFVVGDGHQPNGRDYKRIPH